MSALRFSRPGHPAPTFDNGGLVYEGPTTPRTMGHRFYLLSEVVTTSSRVGASRPVMKLSEYEGPRCNYTLKVSGEPCYRPIHDGSDHRSQAQLAKAAERKKKR